MTEQYTIICAPLPEGEGGGYLASVPELPGCRSDGETPAEAIENAQEAILSWIEAAEEVGRPVPAPGTSTGKWVQRVPKSLHLTLKQVAETEGVSLNAYVTSVLAEKVGQKVSAK